MIENPTEYQKACEELEHLETWLKRLREQHPAGERGLTQAGIRKMIAHLHEELALYEGHLQLEKEPTT